jgi:hypothetical protein
MSLLTCFSKYDYNMIKRLDFLNKTTEMFQLVCMNKVIQVTHNCKHIRVYF